jgi:hypothetical protein
MDSFFKNHRAQDSPVPQVSTAQGYCCSALCDGHHCSLGDAMTLFQILDYDTDAFTVPWDATMKTMKTTTPLVNNITVCVLTILYAKTGLIAIAWWQRFALARVGAVVVSHYYYSKQLVYTLLSMSILFWPLYDTSDWSWRLNTVFPMAMLLRFVYKVRSFRLQSRSCYPPQKLFAWSL